MNTKSNQLAVLLALKQRKVKYVVKATNGQYNPLGTGMIGEVKEIDDAILFEMYGEWPLSETNINSFLMLRTVKIKSQKNSDTDSENANAKMNEKGRVDKAA